MTTDKRNCFEIPLRQNISSFAQFTLSLHSSQFSNYIYILYSYIYIYTRRWLSLFDPHRYLPPGISHSLQLCQGEYISRAVLRFFQFPPIANRDFELFFESMKRTTLLLPFLLITFLRFETNFVNSFFINIISLDEISLLIFDISILYSPYAFSFDFSLLTNLFTINLSPINSKRIVLSQTSCLSSLLQTKETKIKIYQIYVPFPRGRTKRGFLFFP